MKVWIWVSSGGGVLGSLNEEGGEKEEKEEKEGLEREKKRKKKWKGEYIFVLLSVSPPAPSKWEKGL